MAHHMVDVYRRTYGLFAVAGILFNHESPWRGPEFVTRHVTRSVARARVRPFSGPFPIGNLDAVRDWGHAADYVRAIHMMLTADEPRDFVVATGVGHTVRELIEYACDHAGVSTGIFEVDPTRLRASETAPLIGDAGRIRSHLGWSPVYSFEQTIAEMVDRDLARASLA
jgi:GDPmannose 4,6-dehydratase